jgi:endo-1,4-beta-mannosidase
MTGQPFLLGVNYWPRRKAMTWWSAFDPAEVRDEFADIRRMGLDLVRIFLLWEDFQPTPEAVSSRALADLRTVCDLAADAGLTLGVTFFTGHMSGPNWAPRWLLLPGTPMPPWVQQVVSGGRVVNCGYRNPYVDPLALSAAERLLRSVVTALRDHPAITLWNLGNEPDLFARPPDAATGRQWVRRMAGIVREIDSSHPVTCGLHVASLVEDNGLRVPEVFAEVSLPAMHAYPMYADWAADPLDPDFVPFTCALTAALCGRPALMEEFGGCTEAPGRPSGWWEWLAYGQPRRQFMASEEDLAAYVEQVLGRLVEIGALGAVLWGYADYAADLADRPPCAESRHERWFGLVRPDGSWKPHAAVVQRLAAGRPTVCSPRRTLSLDVTPEEYYRDPLGHARRLYQRFRRGAAGDQPGR